MSEQAMVSIIIPVYNGSNYMREAIDSALRQTYSNIEVIVVNDGSCDDGKTRNIALSYDKGIRYFEKENGGVSTALNLGIRHMKGEYFSWLSHDDIYYPNKIETEMQALREAGDMTLAVHSGFDELFMPKRLNRRFVPLEKRYSKKYLESGLCATTIGFISGCSLLIHKNYFEKYGLFDESLRTTQDYAKWFQMFKNKKMLYIAQPLIQSRVHAEQTGATYEKFHAECDELHVWMMKHITLMDTKIMGWDLYHFYSIILPKLYKDGFYNAYRYVYEKLYLLDETPDTNIKIDALKKMLNELGTEIYLYCAGRRGQALLEYFRLRDIAVAGFCDSNKNLWGKYINKKICLSSNDIDKKNALVIVTKADPEDLKNSLVRQGFAHVITYDEIEENLCDIPTDKNCLLKYREEAQF